MDKFEFIAVLVSIVFGVAITNLLTGMVRSYFKREMSSTFTIPMALVISR